MPKNVRTHWISYDSDGNRVSIPINYPTTINNSFTQSIAEDLGYEFPIPCKRCGKEFTKKKDSQKFCTKECSDIYYGRIREAEETNGKSFRDWLNDSIDYSYSPGRF